MSYNDKPTAAFVLSLIGGIIVFVVGFFIMIVGAAFTYGLFDSGVIGGIYGFLGVIWGILMIVGATMLRIKPERHITWGLIVLIASILSWFGAFGGLFIGFILGLVGGILGIVWKPSDPPTVSITRICPYCGIVLTHEVKFCPHCGKALA